MNRFFGMMPVSEIKKEERFKVGTDQLTVIIQVWLSYFSCFYNNLTTLEYAPKEVGGGFYCYNNNLTSLEFAPKEVGGYFYCYNNNLLDIEALDKCRIGGELDISDNPIFNLVKDIVIRDLDVFYMIKPLQGNKLSRLLYDEVREDLRLPKFDYSTLHKDIELID